MGALKVGELYAELGLEDNLDKAMDKAEAKFKATGKGMDATAKLGLDSSELTTKLAAAESDAKSTTKTIGNQAPTIDGSKISDGISDGLSDAEGMVSQAGGKLGGLLTAGIAGAAAVGGAFVVEMFGQSLEREAGTAKLGIQLGLPPEMAKVAGARAGAVYAQGFGENLSNVNDAVRGVTQNMGGLGNMSAEEFDEMTKGVLTLSDAFDEDLNAVTRAAGKLIKNGLAKDGKEALDLLTRGLSSPANEAGDLLDTFSEYSTELRQLGLTGPQMLGLIGQGLQGGARDADTVTDALKEFVIKAQDGTKASATAFQTIGLNGGEMARIIATGGPPASAALQTVMERLRAIEDPALRAQTATGLFGTKAEDLQGALYALDVATATEKIGTVEGAMNSAVTATDTSASRIEAWKRVIEGNVVGFIDREAIPALGRLADKYHELFGEDSGENLRRGAAVLGGDEPGGDGKPWWDLSNFLQFDDGGVVPGPVGSPQIVMAHAGETILPTHKAGAAAPAGSSSGMTRSRRGRTTTVVKVGTAELARVQRRGDRAWS